MAETKKQFNIFEVQRTFVLSVDMIVACIQFYRKKRRALKAIHLKPRYYGQFKLWVQSQTSEEEVETKRMQVDGVNIELASKFQTDNLRAEFWPEA